MPRGDVFPRRNLPNEAEQWGRAHDARIVEAEASLDRIEQSVQGLNRSTASSLTSIARQIETIQEQQAEIKEAQDELNARKTYSASGSNFTTSVVNSVQTGSPRANISFTLAESRTVLFTATASQSSFAIMPPGIGSSILRNSIELRVDELNAAVNSSSQGLQFTTSAPGVYTSSSGSLQLSRTLTLPAGAHTADLVPSIYITGESGASTISTIALSVQVLDRA